MYGCAVLERELAFANELADRAAEIALRWFRGDGLEVRWKDDRTPVTQADLEIEAMVREALPRAFPGDTILGEEGGGEVRAGRTWIVDPIDGTKNFADGVQIWATLIALAVDGEPALGVVSAPALGERYEAVRGGGARLNGRRIRVSRTPDLPQAFVGFTELRDWLEGPHREAFLGLAGSVRRTRGLGDFWGHVLVARGSLDAMLEPELATWDWAALKVIVEEAGGRVTRFDGGPLTHGGSAVTTNGILHGEVLARLAPGRRGRRRIRSRP